MSAARLRGVGASVLLISHDLAVVAQLCERVLAMYVGAIVEDLPVARPTEGPHHPYTRRRRHRAGGRVGLRQDHAGPGAVGLAPLSAGWILPAHRRAVQLVFQDP
ncbi:hypothetical protein ACIBG7_11860 [Nonomuraea sp. NPDC050328]|uniref:hypothetical protein n=1 Tax=Nonomuraea sp. NPDC050328 TaxID=3364361 RepID=UPI003789F346